VPPVIALPMYDWPEVRPATVALAAALNAALLREGLPAAHGVARANDVESLWRRADLAIGQTCGAPYARGLSAHVDLIATPHYAVEGCAGPYYRSAIIARSDDDAKTLADLAGRRAAFNDAGSQSGWFALAGALRVPPAALGDRFDALVETGAHRASIMAVAEGRADCAAIDAVAWALARRHMPAQTHGLRVLAWSPFYPALPFVVSRARPVAERRAIRRAVFAAFAEGLPAVVRAALFLAGISPLSHADYAGLILPRVEAA